MIVRKKMIMIVITVVGIGISVGLNFNSIAYSEETKISRDAIELLSKTDRAMAEVAAAVKPAVVITILYSRDSSATNSAVLDNLANLNRPVSDRVLSSIRMAISSQITM